MPVNSHDTGMGTEGVRAAVVPMKAMIERQSSQPGEQVKPCVQHCVPLALREWMMDGTVGGVLTINADTKHQARQDHSLR